MSSGICSVQTYSTYIFQKLLHLFITSKMEIPTPIMLNTKLNSLKTTCPTHIVLSPLGYFSDDLQASELLHELTES